MKIHIIFKGLGWWWMKRFPFIINQIVFGENIIVGPKFSTCTRQEFICLDSINFLCFGWDLGLDCPGRLFWQYSQNISPKLKWRHVSIFLWRWCWWWWCWCWWWVTRRSIIQTSTKMAHVNIKMPCQKKLNLFHPVCRMIKIWGKPWQAAHN